MFLLAFLSALLAAQAPALSFDFIVNDFGDRLKSEEVLVCEFPFTNTSARDVSISYALATCSCTDVKWTTGIIAPGGKGSVKAVYHRERYADSFEKFISVFVQGESKPYLLRISGRFHDDLSSIVQEFKFHCGPLALRASQEDLGVVHPGKPAGKWLEFANPTDSLLVIDFPVLPQQLALDQRHVELLPYERHFLSYSVVPDSMQWGAVNYSLVPTVNGAAQDSIVFTGVAVPDYSQLSPAEINSSPYVQAVYKDVGFGQVTHSSSPVFTVRIENKSSDAVRILSVSSDEPAVVFPEVPEYIEGKAKLRLEAGLAAASLPVGPNIFHVYFVLDTPLTPLVTISVQGYVVSE